MPGRIITLQRQARELGRLRAGWSEPYTDKFGKEKRKPVKSTTWLLSSPQRDYIDAAADMWGGVVEEWQPQGNGAQVWRVVTEARAVDAILPPGDTLSQSYELWSRGGCVRRCDGELERLTDKTPVACLCRAEFGDTFHLEPPEKACRPYTRLGVILPDLPDLGVWRMESKGFYAANEITAAVDLIQHATGGKLAVPIRLRIEPRTRVAKGKTKQFPVIVVEIRGVTAGQIMAGVAPAVALEGSPQRQAIEAAAPPEQPPVDYRAMARLARDPETIRGLWRAAAKAGHLDEDLKAFLTGRVADFEPPEPESPAEAPPAAEPDGEAEPVEGEVEPNRDAEWMRALIAGGKRGLNTAQVAQLCRETVADPLSCNGFQMRAFADQMEKGEIQ